jgi:hypothetical protein
MKKTQLFFIVLLPLAMAITSCGNQAGAGQSDTLQDSATTGGIADNVDTVGTMLSSTSHKLAPELYVGMFEASDAPEAKKYYYKNKISVSIDSIGGGKLKGHSVVAGNNRPFEGAYEEKNGTYIITAKEPGDDKYDGVFSFTLFPDKSLLEGTWEANNKKLEVVKRSYSLTTSVFRYDANTPLNPDLIGSMLEDWTTISKLEEEPGSFEAITPDAIKINASMFKLKKEDVENMYKGDLEIMRNAIYARHGYSFKNKRMRYIFDTSVDWYIPVTTDVRNELTDLEKENIALIKRYEEHAGKYYDSYGR